VKQLLLHFIEHPKEIENINEYMDKVKMNKQPFTAWLRDITGSMVWIVNIHNKYIEDHIEIPYKDGKYTAIKHTFKPKKA
jgi:hypothetical protein